MRVVKDLVIIVTYRNTLEYTQVINLTNVMFVLKCLVRIVTYRHTLEYIQVIHLMNLIYKYMVKFLIRIIGMHTGDTPYKYDIQKCMW